MSIWNLCKSKNGVPKYHYTHYEHKCSDPELEILNWFLNLIYLFAVVDDVIWYHQEVLIEIWNQTSNDEIC